MGCFSFLCVNSGKPALSTSFDGSPCYLYLMKQGKIIEEMYGNYDSYGRVFNDVGDSLKWEMPWSEVCELMFNNDSDSGIAMVLEEYYDGELPMVASENDPNQGWGSFDEEDDEECLLGDCSDDMFPQVKAPYHKTYYDNPLQREKSPTQSFYVILKSELKDLMVKKESIDRQIQDVKSTIEILERKDEKDQD